MYASFIERSLVEPLEDRQPQVGMRNYGLGVLKPGLNRVLVGAVNRFVKITPELVFVGPVRVGVKVGAVLGVDKVELGPVAG
jgi:hypothetical protein